MPPTKLKTLSQDLLLGPGGGPAERGACYYMCNFIESDKGPWHQPGVYSNACAAATSFSKGGTMVRQARAANLRKGAQTVGYSQVTGALTFDRIYRVELWVGSPPVPAGAQPNHEIILITGANNDELVYFDPNFGFYEAPSAAQGNNNRQNFEHWCDWQYTQNSEHAANFAYLEVRDIALSQPLGFS